MKENGLDKKLRDLFADEVPMDLDAAWDRLERRRGKNKKPRFIFLLFLVGAGVLVSLLIGYSVFNSKTEDATIITPNEIASHTLSNTQITEEITENAINHPINSQIEEKSTEDKAEKSNIQTTQHTNNSQVNATIFRHKIIELPEIASIETALINQSNIHLNFQKEGLSTMVDRDEIEKVDFVNSLPFELLAIEPYDVQFSKKYMKNTILTPTKPQNLSLGLAFSYGNSFRDLKATENAQTGFVNNRNKIESTTHTKGIDLSISKDMNRLFFIQTGIAYTNISSKLEESRTISYDTILDNQVVEIYQGQKIYGRQSAKATEIVNFSLWQNYHSISIPIILGMHTPVKSNTYFSFGIGVQSGVSQVSGSILTPNKEVVSLSDFSYRNIGVLQGIAQVEFGFAFNNNWRLTAGLNYQKDLNSRTKDVAGFTEKYQLLTGKIGVRYKL